MPVGSVGRGGEKGVEAFSRGGEAAASAENSLRATESALEVGLGGGEFRTFSAGLPIRFKETTAWHAGSSDGEDNQDTQQGNQ